MARAALQMGVRELADSAMVSTNTITRFEKGEDLKDRTVNAIRAALEAAGVRFLADGDVAAGPGVVLRLPARQAATEAELQASANEVRSQAASAVDVALSGSDATAQQKAERRGALTDEPAVVGRARGKGQAKKPPK